MQTNTLTRLAYPPLVVVEKAEKQRFSAVFLILKSIIILFYVFPVWSFAQNNCANPNTITYAQSFPGFQTYYFQNSTSLWFTFISDSSGNAHLLIESDTTNGAVLESFKAYTGNCTNLQLVEQLNYTSNDSLSVSLGNLSFSQQYWVKLSLDTVNGCSTCSSDIHLSLLSSDTLTDDLIITFNTCNSHCFTEIIVPNGDFDVTDPQGFTHPGYTTWFPPDPNNPSAPILPTPGTVFIGDDASQYFSGFVGTGFQASTTSNFLMSDFPKKIVGEYPLTTWQQSYTGFQIGKMYKFSFYALNLNVNDSVSSYWWPMIEVTINDVVIPHSNVTYSYPNQPSLNVKIPKDETWHLLCYYWECDNSSPTIKINQLPYNGGLSGDYSYGHDLGIDHITLWVENKENVEITSPVYICDGESIELSQFVVGNQGIAPYFYKWNNLTNGNFLNVVSPHVNTTYFLTVTDATHCERTGEIEVIVTPNPGNPGITGINNNCKDQILTYTCDYLEPNLYYSWSVISPANTSWGSFIGASQGYGLNSVNLTWDQINFPVPPEYAVLHLTFQNACGKFDLYDTIFQCCPRIPEQDFVFTDEILVNMSHSNEIIVINGEVTIQGTVSFENCEVYMGPMAKITADNSSLFIVEGATSFTTCSEYMWDGIYSDKTTSDVHVLDLPGSNPLITNALNGIVSTKGGHAFIRSAHFRDNYHSITVSDYYPSMAGYYGLLDFMVYSSQFWVEQAGMKSLLPPYAGITPHCGIFLNNAEVVLGIENALPNTFLDHQRGIYSLNSDADIFNAHFENCPPDLLFSNAWPFDQAGILATVNASKALIDPPSLTVQSILQPIEFINCKSGVSTFGNQSFVRNCDFSDCEFAVHFLNPLFPSQVIDCDIEKSGSGNFDIPGYGISVISANPAISDEPLKTWVENNHISGIQNGIHFFNQNNVGHFPPNEHRIFENTITFENVLPGNARAYRHGILAENCDGINIYGNTVDYPNWAIDNNLNNRGLRISRSPGSYVAHNTFTSLDAGIYTNGELQNTQFLCNTFVDCWNGFFFGKATAMTDQHFYYNQDYYCNNNRWIGSYSNPGNHYKLTQDVDRSYLANSFEWYYDPSIPGNEFKPDLDLINQNPNHYCRNIIFCPPDIDNISICPYVDGLIDDPSSSLDTIKRSYLFEDILNEQIVYDTLIAQNRYYEKDYLYTFLLRNSSLINLGGPDDENYQNFVDSMYNTNSSFIQKVYGFMQGQRLDSASYYNDMISFSDTWVENRKAVNTHYLNYWASGNYEIFEDDSLALLSIALQTPYEGGDGVYTARCLLNLFDVESMGTAYSSMIPGNGYAKLRVWPNPAENWVTIELPVMTEQPSMLEICSMDGRLIREEKVSEKATEHRLSTSKMDNGCYFVRIKSAENILEIGRFCVIH